MNIETLGTEWNKNTIYVIKSIICGIWEKIESRRTLLCWLRAWAGNHYLGQGAHKKEQVSDGMLMIDLAPIHPSEFWGSHSPFPEGFLVGHQSEADGSWDNNTPFLCGPLPTRLLREGSDSSRCECFPTSQNQPDVFLSEIAVPAGQCAPPQSPESQLCGFCSKLLRFRTKLLCSLCMLWISALQTLIRASVSLNPTLFLVHQCLVAALKTGWSCLSFLFASSVF